MGAKVQFPGHKVNFGMKAPFLQARFWLSIEVPFWGICVLCWGEVSMPGGEFSFQGPGFMIAIGLWVLGPRVNFEAPYSKMGLRFPSWAWDLIIRLEILCPGKKGRARGCSGNVHLAGLTFASREDFLGRAAED